jgi:hypothetical protein
MMVGFVAKQQPQILPSSSGLTGRSGTLRTLDFISNGYDYWIPAFAGMTREVQVGYADV